MDEKQIRLINWMYNMNVICFMERNDVHTQEDIRKLREAVMRRFPENWFDIVKPFSDDHAPNRS